MGAVAPPQMLAVSMVSHRLAATCAEGRLAVAMAPHRFTATCVEGQLVAVCLAHDLTAQMPYVHMLTAQMTPHQLRREN